MRILVTGGAGFIGSALVRRLAGDGHEVRVLDDFSRGQPSRLDGLKVAVVHGDIRNRGPVARAVAGCEAVFHLAAVNGTASFYEQPRRVLDTAIVGTMNVLGACELYGVRDLLLMSSSEAHQAAQVPTPETVPLTVPDPLNPRYSYGGGKIAAEILAGACAAERVLDRLIIVRPHNCIGPDMGTGHVIPQFALRMNELTREHPAGVIPFPIQGSGQETRSFCYIADCIEQLALLLAKAPDGAHVYHAGTMDERTVAETAHAVADCYGRAIEVVPGPLQPGSPARRCPDTGKVEALGYKPSVPFAEAVGRTVAWYQAHG